MDEKPNIIQFIEAAALAIQGIDEGAVPQENQLSGSLTEALKVRSILLFQIVLTQLILTLDSCHLVRL